ncbi:MAG: PilW family protein [Burkholderiaceae bacterium]|nr:PilW family protein [Rhodoferax sp.]MCP5287211.1 PilW family protein [Burkholderiaceae bacterium]
MSGPSLSSRQVARPVPPRHAQRGLSIVELMVGLVVAMLVSIAAAGSAMMFTASQRQGIGVGGSGIGAATALAALKNDAALAGLGFFGDANYLCNTLALSTGPTLHSDSDTFTPVRITAGDDGDTIDIVYGNRVESGANVLLASASDGTSAALQSLMPTAAGQAVLLAPATPGAPCLVRTVTAVTPSTDTTPQLLTFAADGTHNQGAFTAMPTFAERDRITLIGALSWNRYRRDGNTLVLDRPLTGDTAVLTRNVIALRAQYGVATAGGTTLEQWVDAGDGFAVLDATTLPRVRAIRMGVVTRSPQRERPDANGNCDASLDKPQLFGVEIEPDVDDWQCWRYRVSTVVVPMRNLVLGLRE